ncbi:hypothetical protein Despr_3226 [Desulfobulbus propionicus DSM 2032]|jgi:uncharacterized lipoprotein YajG|uniref:Uncharacterized protein n=1 Tax=Desulfobulbus propionicus (strain ATCC 33891 / DSM 2032 / VKM B-1956 / 1pr3) TaxID=577650 RepID=A0A7U3YPV5_DESPD|nr:hypothetical protein [Desulfobulbus propionicus]ADW19354.1 hypothetical protein Despr_3226 [Desulfobulbus propionicus DSM 2032]
MNGNRTIVQAIILALGLVTLAGCAPQRQWSKPGLNQADFDRDAARCRREAAVSTQRDPFAPDAGHGLERANVQEKLFEQCMTARGYRLVEGEESGR